MPTFQEWFNQHKTAIYVGMGATGVIVFVILSRQGSSGKPRATLDTIDADLQSIDKRLQAENSYLSSSASMSPLTPGIDVIDLMEPAAQATARTPSEPMPKPSPKPVVKPPVKSKPHGNKDRTGGANDFTGGGQDYNMAYAKQDSFGFGGDANDFWSLN